MALLYGADYCDKFSIDVFLKDFWGSANDLNVFLISTTYSFLNDERLTGHRFLDLGCGPSVCGVITAPERFNDIVMADLSPSNLDIIRQWMDGKKPSFDWDHILKLTAELAAAKDVSEWIERKTYHLKSSIKNLVTCDVVNEQPLGADFRESFDVVFSSFTFGCAAKNIADYTQILKNASTLLPSGGHLVIRGALRSKSYTVDSKVFHHLSYTESELKEALRRAHFEVLEYKSQRFKFSLCEADGYEVYVLLAKKELRVLSGLD